MNSGKERAVILLSGGLDSVTALSLAREQYECYALSFSYGQRHDAARERVYGMPYDQWKDLYQKEATAEQLAAFNNKKSG